MAALLLFGVLGAVAGFVVPPALEVSGNSIVIYYMDCRSWQHMAILEQNLSKRKDCRKTKRSCLNSTCNASVSIVHHRTTNKNEFDT